MKTINEFLEAIKNQPIKKPRYLHYYQLILGKEYACINLVSGCQGFNGTGVYINPAKETFVHGLESHNKGVHLRKSSGEIWKVNGDFLLL